MGLREMLKEAREESVYTANCAGHYLVKGEYRYGQKNSSAIVRRPVEGAVAEFETGADVGGRTTLTRVAAGAIIAGPVGAIVGGMFKKDRAKVYVTITFPDGAVVILEAPAKDEAKAREFAQKVNAAANRVST